MSDQSAPNFIFPPALIGRADLSRLVREVEAIDNDLESQKVRARSTGAGYSMPTMSRGLTDFLELNKLDMADDHGRMVLTEQLRRVKDKAPVMHVVFAVDADPDFLQQLTAWIRQNLHPQALISVGLQPGLVGGVYIRTPNHVHDFSVKALLAGKRDIILNELEGLRAG